MKTKQVNSLLLALKAIAGMTVTAETDHKQMTALCISIAKIELQKFCCGDAACYNESSGVECAAMRVTARSRRGDETMTDLFVLEGPNGQKTEIDSDVLSRLLRTSLVEIQSAKYPHEIDTRTIRFIDGLIYKYSNLL